MDGMDAHRVWMICFLEVQINFYPGLAISSFFSEVELLSANHLHPNNFRRFLA